MNVLSIVLVMLNLCLSMSETKKNNVFGIVLKVIIAVASALAGALGYSQVV